MRRLGPILAMTLLAAAGLAMAPAAGRTETTPPAGYEAWIDIAREGGLWRVEPLCRAPEDAALTYRLTARKQGRSGTSSSAQSGRVGAKAGQAQSLCHLSLGVHAGDSYEFTLEIFKDGQKVAQAAAASPRGI